MSNIIFKLIIVFPAIKLAGINAISKFKKFVLLIFSLKAVSMSLKFQIIIIELYVILN